MQTLQDKLTRSMVRSAKVPEALNLDVGSLRNGFLFIPKLSNMEKKKQAISRKSTFIGTKSDASKLFKNLLALESPDTLKFFECLLDFIRLDRNVRDALQLAYGKERGERIFLNEYGPDSEDLRFLIQNFLFDTLSEKLDGSLKKQITNLKITA